MFCTKCSEKLALRYTDRLFSSSFHKVAIKLTFRQETYAEEKKILRKILFLTLRVNVFSQSRSSKKESGFTITSSKRHKCHHPPHHHQHHLRRHHHPHHPHHHQIYNGRRANFDIVSDGGTTVGWPERARGNTAPKISSPSK